MKTRIVEELMVLLSDYAVVDGTATLYEAVLALEAAQASFDSERYRHRAALVLDAQGRVIGKVGHTDMLRALEPKYETVLERESMAYTGMTRAFMKSLMEKYSLWGGAMHDICKKAAVQRVRDFMHVPTDGEFIEADATLDQAIHQFVVGGYQSLLVRQNGTVIGILRLTDVFAAVSAAVKSCAV